MLFIILIGFTYGVVMANLWLPDKMSEIVNNGIIKQDMSAIWNNGLMMILVTAAGWVLLNCRGFFGGANCYGNGAKIAIEIV